MFLPKEYTNIFLLVHLYLISIIKTTENYQISSLTNIYVYIYLQTCVNSGIPEALYFLKNDFTTFGRSLRSLVADIF